MYENIFERVEEKYLLTKEQYTKLFNNINDFIEKDKYYETTICNIYFDNKEHEIIYTSLDKPIYKHKVRLRSYGIPKIDDDVFLEIKFKYKKVVGKRRVKLKLKEFKDYINKNKYDNNSQIMKEIDYLFNLYNLKPSYFVAYDRKSYREKNNTNLRITIDTNLRSRKDDLSLELGDKGKLYFAEQIYIMEIKTLGAMPLWLVKNLSDLGIYPVSFSKFGSIYEKEKEEKVC
ncbi:MAG: VTC domain-containing protein [Bacilli bacterium]